jgi:hypothetical protein
MNEWINAICFKQFAMQTSTTDVIILDAPHHHDLEEN